MKYTVKNNFSAIAFSLAVGMSAAHAANNSATITVKGRVSAVTCDVQPQGVVGGVLDLGVVNTSDFTAPDTLVGRTTLNINLANCALGTQSGGVYGVFVDGATLQGSDNVFSDRTSGSVGVKVIDSTGQSYKGGEFIASTTDKGSTATIPVTIAMVAPFQSVANPVTPEDVNATIKFTADYL
ncbi:TPA: type 1 fimbrial protein [Aeromonas sobria]|nr:type 1 fimbrial protein [Aeromonas sobria]